LPRRLAFTADPTTAEPRIGNRTIAIRPTDERFELVVRERNATLGTGPLPTTGANVTVGGITFNRSQRDVYAIYDGTRVRVAQKEQSGRAALGG
jgi:hypothetical protein